MPNGIGEITETGFVAELRRGQRQHGRTLAQVQVPQPAKDMFTVASTPATTYTLSAIPYQGTGGSSLNLSLNGLELVEGVDYTVDYTTAIVTVTATLKGTPTPADVLTADYWTTGDLIAATGPADTGSITDSFNRADSATSLGTTSDGSATWTAILGTWGISSNQAYRPVSSGTRDMAVIDTGHSDGTITVTVNPAAGAPGIAFRLQDGSNLLVVGFQSGNIYFDEIAAGGSNFFVGTPTTVVAGDTIGVQFAGSSIQRLHNGVAVGSVITRSTYQTNTKHGIHDGSGVGTTQRWDDWTFYA